FERNRTIQPATLASADANKRVPEIPNRLGHRRDRHFGIQFGPALIRPGTSAKALQRLAQGVAILVASLKGEFALSVIDQFVAERCVKALSSPMNSIAWVRR